MSEHNPLVDVDRDTTPRLPLSFLVDWHNEMAAGLDTRKEAYRHAQAAREGGGSVSDQDLSFELGRFTGERNVLLAFYALLLTTSADQAGQLDPDQA